MNSLSTRLSLAFIAVTLVAVLIVALAFGWYTDNQVRGYLERRDQMWQNNQAGGPSGGGPPWNNGHPPPRPADVAFLQELRGALIIAAFVAGGVGIILGILITRAIASPLGNLANAAHDFAARHWERRVEVRGVAEVAEVAQAFNAMADELQRAETLRRNLMADIAHELRTPLTVIQGNLRALLDGVYPLELKEIASLYDETRLLTRLVSDLRELALAESGKTELHIEPVDVAVVLQAAMDNFSVAAESQDTIIEVRTTPDLPQALADADRLRQVLYNLMTNALRHAAAGRVTLAAGIQQGNLRVSVQDTGEGIQPNDLPYLFDRFYRADSSRTRATGGSGLGLAIAKTWVELMGGKIGVESILGQGSTFWVMLPLAPQSEVLKVPVL